MTEILAIVVAAAALVVLVVRERAHARERAQLTAQLEEARSRSSESEELASVGAMVSDLAQELKAPLQGVLGNTELMMMSGRGGEDAEELREISQNATRAAGIVRNLLAFADTSHLKRAWNDVNEIVSRAAAVCRADIPGDRFLVELALAARLPLLYVDGRQLEHVLAAFLGRTAKELIDRTGMAPVRIRVSTGRSSQPDDRIVIDIDEEGSLLPRLNQSFGDGGLPACSRIIEAHGGVLTIRDRPRGLHVRLEFPIMADPASEAASPVRRADPAAADPAPHTIIATGDMNPVV